MTALVAAEAPEGFPPVDPAVESTYPACIRGYVYDADTLQPVSQATVAIWQDGAFSTTGDTCAATDETGAYATHALGGSLKKKVDLLGGLLFGKGKKRTQRLDLAKCVVQVSAEGYQAFCGIVPVRSADASAMTVRLEPVLLSPTGSVTTSYVPVGWGPLSVKKIMVEPAVIKPGESYTVTVELIGPKLPTNKSIKGYIFSPVLGFAHSLDGKPAADGTMVFSRKYGLSKKAKDGCGRVVYWVSDAPCYALERSNYTTPLVQITKTEAQAQAAPIRAEIYQLCDEGKASDAFARYKEIAASDGLLVSDMRMMRQLGRQIQAMPEAASYAEQWAQSRPKEEQAEAQMLRGLTLLEARQPQQALDAMVAYLDAIPEKDREKQTPPGVRLVMGMACLKLGQIDEAQKHHDVLAGKKDLPYLDDLSYRLRLAQIERAVQKPEATDSDWANYAGILLDDGKWDQGVEVLTKALQQHPDSAPLRWSLRYAQLHIAGGEEAAAEGLDQALAAAEQQLQPDAEGAEKVKDFGAWHAYMLLLFRKYDQQRQSGDATGAASSLARCARIAQRALRCARAGASVALRAGALSNTQVYSITGWAYPEAQNDFHVLGALRRLSAAPDDVVAKMVVANELLSLGLYSTAAPYLAVASAASPDDPQVLYLQAKSAELAGSPEVARNLLERVIAACPHHAQANLELSRHYLDDGEMGEATTCLLKHTQFYGPEAQGDSQEELDW